MSVRPIGQPQPTNANSESMANPTEFWCVNAKIIRETNS